MTKDYPRSIREIIYQAMIAMTDYDEVPLEHIETGPRYSFLKQMLDEWVSEIEYNEYIKHSE